MSPTRPVVFIVDDDPKQRASLAFLVESLGVAVATYPTAEAFLAAYDPERPGCLVLDLQMPGMGGLALIEHLASRGDFRPTIVLTGHGDVPTAVRAMKAGVMEFLQKPFDGDVFLEFVRTSVTVDAEWRRWRRDSIEVARRKGALSPRENEVMDLVATGKSTAQIADILNLSRHTVETHRASVLRKMGADTAIELAFMASLCRPATAFPHPASHPRPRDRGPYGLSPRPRGRRG